MASRLEAVALASAVVAAGAVYVMVHEARRKRKKAEKVAREAPISKEMLLTILSKSAEASKAVVERLRVEVKKIQEARKLSDEQATQLFTQNFEHSLDQLIGAIRNQYRVSEKAMDTSFKQHQNDPDVRAAIQNMRTLSQTSAAPAAAAGSGAAQAAPAQAGAASLPESLTKDRLREIMTFNAVTLEKELKPIKEQMARIREQGQTPQVSPQLLQQVQARISEQVRKKYGVSDEEVMMAVEVYGAREDPAFKDILQRIANTFTASFN